MLEDEAAARADAIGWPSTEGDLLGLRKRATSPYRERGRMPVPALDARDAARANHLAQEPRRPDELQRPEGTPKAAVLSARPQGH